MKKFSAGLTIGLIILGSLGILLTISSTSVSAFISHEPIIINSNIDFSNQGWPGNGTEMNPWVIEGFDINGTSHEYGISVSNTTDNFIIRSCYIHNSNFDGINIYNAQFGDIINNNITFNERYGIKLTSSTNINISNNIVHFNKGDGIMALFCRLGIISDGNIIQNNIVNHNNGSGILVLESPIHTVSNNTVNNNNGWGIHFRTSPYSKITNNNISNNSWAGLCIVGSSNTVISNNTFTSNSQCDIDSDSNTNLTMSGNNFEIGISIDGGEPYIPGNEGENGEETPGFEFEIIFLAAFVGLLIYRRKQK